MTKTYAVYIIGAHRFLYSNDGVKFLKDQTSSYFPYWKMKSNSVVALRSESSPTPSTVKSLPQESWPNCQWTSVWLTPAAPKTASRKFAPLTSAKATPSALRCCPRTCSCPPAFRPTPRCLSPHLASLPLVPSGDQVLSFVLQPRLRPGLFYGVFCSPVIN